MSNHYFVKHPKSKLDLGILRTYFRGRLFEFVTASGVFSRYSVCQVFWASFRKRKVRFEFLFEVSKDDIANKICV